MENTTIETANANVNVADVNVETSTINPTVETSNTATIMDNAIQKSLSIIPNSAVKPDPLGIVILGFGIVGVGATGYGIYRLIKWGVGKIKESKPQQEAKEAEPVENEEE